MNERKVAIVFMTAALLVPMGLAAQVASRLEADALVTGKDGELPSNALRFSPGIRFDRPNIALSARGSAWLSQQQWQVADGIVSGTFTAPTVYGVRAELLANASRAFDERSLGNDQVDVATRVHVLFKQRGGIWLGAGVARPWRIAAVSSVDIADAGAWTQVANATMTTTLTNFFLTKSSAAGDSGTAQVACSTRSAVVPAAAAHLAADAAVAEGAPRCERQTRFSDLEGAIHWELGTLELNAQTGYRFGSDSDIDPDSRRWSSASATVWLNDRMAFVAGGGRQPANMARGIPARRFGTVGVVLAYWPIPKGVVPVAAPRAMVVKTFEIRPAADGMQKITIRVGGVETVDVMGDFSDWSPLTLQRRGRDLWELSLPMSAGIHQINVRVDGGDWLAPPGMPTVKSFSGEVGMLVVQQPEK